MPNFISEDEIEQTLVKKLRQLYPFDSLNCYTEDPENLSDGSGRANKRDVIFVDRVREAALTLNPEIPEIAIEQAMERFLQPRNVMSLVEANQEIYNLLRDGIPVEFDNRRGEKQQGRVYLIDFNQPDSNRFLLVTQLWIKGELGFRRPDVFGLVLSQSGAFQRGLPAEFARADRLSLRFSLDAGVLETTPFQQFGSLYHANVHLHDVLVAKGYDVSFRTFPGGHDYFWWRETIADGLIALLGA